MQADKAQNGQVQDRTELQPLIAEYGRLRRLEGHTPQSRGQRLNDVIAAMLRCWGIDARSSVRSKGEVDVAFAAGGIRYVVEAKWENRPSDTGHIAELQKRVRQRLAGTYGVFLSMAGYTAEALADVADGDRLEVLLLDAEHFEAMLSGLVAPEEMLSLVHDRAAFFGEAYVPLLTLIGTATDLPTVAFGTPSSWPGGLVEWAHEGVTADLVLTLSDSSQLGIEANEDGRLLVTTQYGILAIDVQTESVHWAAPISGCHRNTSVQADGAVWFTRRSGVGRYAEGKIRVMGGALFGSTCLVPHLDGSMWVFANGSSDGPGGASITRLGDALGDEVRLPVDYAPGSAFTSAWVSQNELLTIGPEFLTTRIDNGTVHRYQARQSNPMGLVSLGDYIAVTAGDSVTLGMTDLNTGKYVVLARLGLKPSVNELCLAPDKSVYIASYYGDSSDLPIAIVRISLPPASELGAEIRLELEPVATQTFSGIELSALAQREAPRDPGPVGDQGQTGQFEADPSFTNGSPGVLYLMPCGLQVARDVGILVDLAQRDGWEVCIITTPEGREFVDVPALERQTGHPVRTHRDVNDVNSLPSADAIIVAPATVNTIGKWAAGITDTLVLSLLAQAYGYGIPIVVVPYPDRIAALHPRFQGSLAELRSWGVQVLYGEEVARLGGPGQEDRFRSQFPWRRALQAISVRME